MAIPLRTLVFFSPFALWGGRPLKKNLECFRLSTTKAKPPYDAEPLVFPLPAVKE